MQCQSCATNLDYQDCMGGLTQSVHAMLYRRQTSKLHRSLLLFFCSKAQKSSRTNTEAWLVLSTCWLPFWSLYKSSALAWQFCWHAVIASGLMMFFPPLHVYQVRIILKKKKNVMLGPKTGSFYTNRCSHIHPLVDLVPVVLQPKIGFHLNRRKLEEVCLQAQFVMFSVSFDSEATCITVILLNSWG